jgi:uncharacterized membrane protein YdbT with pleckstrin-like domain
MGYVQQVLQPGEQIVYQTRLSWAMYIPGLAMFVVAIFVFAVLRAAVPGDWWGNGAGGVLLLIAIYMIVREWFVRWTTEVAITNRRIIFKKGFIRRDTIEMSLDKVESVDVQQSLLGRLLDYGDIIVRGTGSGFAPLKTIDAPLEFRSHVTAG